MSHIKVYRMMNGEEFIGEFVEFFESRFKLRNVGVIQLVPNAKGTVSVALVPFAPYGTNTEFEFERGHVTTSFDPNTDLLNSYNKIFGSGIEIVPAGGIDLSSGS